MDKITLTLQLTKPVRENKEWKKIYPNRFDTQDYNEFRINCQKIGLTTGVVLGLAIKEINKEMK